MIALATENFAEIGATIADHFKSNGLPSTIRNLSVAEEGMRLHEKIAQHK